MVVRVDPMEERRLDALSLVREGRLYDLGRVLDERAPVFPGRHFRQLLVPNAMPVGSLNWVADIVSTTTQVGTHLDALCHLSENGRIHGGHAVADVASPSGFTEHGIETVPQIVTRGWLVDASGLGPGEVIGLEHVAAIDPEPGDAVLFHTGWGAHWDDPDRYLSGEPGPGCTVAHWLAERGVALTGCDTWSYGPVPAEHRERPFEVPQILNVRHGVFIVENLDLSALAADGVREFCLILTHPKLRGATGAWTSPIALT
ncbi:MAG TPA: cyclase family protein [Solirubrobacteraceae bacterium]|nr:cyclase family protein [Solirubrobacteraceae bacterium]